MRTAIKLLLVVSLIQCMAQSSYSQIHGGIKGGANFLYSRWEIPGLVRSYSGVSYHAGLFGSLKLKPKLFLQSEIQFNSFKIDYSGETYTANYISVPVLGSFSFLNNLLNIHIGPQVSFLLSAKPETLDFAIGKTEFAAAGGIGLTHKQFHLTARYLVGISNLASKEVKESFPDATIRNYNFQLSIGYQVFGKAP